MPTMTASMWLSAIGSLSLRRPMTLPHFFRGIATILSIITCDGALRPFSWLGSIVRRYSGASTRALVRSATSRLSVAVSQSDWMTTFAVVARRGDGGEIASPHSSPQEKAASMKARASASSGRPRSSRPCRAASLANSGRVGSGTHTRNSFMPLSAWVRR